jgi:hypothetical protein
LQGGDAVVLLKRGGFGGDLGGLELDLFRIFFGLDFDETFDRLFHCFGEVVLGFDFFTVHFLHRQIREIVVADCAVGRENLAKNHDATVSFWK